MFISCVICGDLFTGLEAHESVYITPCGHLFHHHCILAWFDRSKTCPQCRQKVTDKKIVKVFFNLSNTTNDEDPSMLKHRLDSLEYQMKVKEREIKIVEAERDKSISQTSGLRKEVKEANRKALNSEQALFSLKNEIAVLRTCCKEYSITTQENQDLKRKIEAMKHCEMVMQGTEDEAEIALENADAFPELGRCVLFFKKRVKRLESEHKFTQSELMAKKKKINSLHCSLTQAEFEIAELKREIGRLRPTYTGDGSFLKETVSKPISLADDSPISPMSEDCNGENKPAHSSEPSKSVSAKPKDVPHYRRPSPSRTMKPTTLKLMQFANNVSQLPRLHHSFRLPLKSTRPVRMEAGDDNFHPQRYNPPAMVAKKPKKKLSASATSALGRINKDSNALASSTRRIDSFMESIDLT